jgi:predicted RNA-binding Zn-ribbon protein involved in translation (DUF1610 family)
MIHRIHNQIEFECDDCGELLDTGATEWTDAMRAMKIDGWVSRKNGNQWEHYCEACEWKHP